MKSSMAQRAIRTPFRNTEIMTARGFGKRGNGDDPENGKIGDENWGDSVNESQFILKILF